MKENYSGLLVAFDEERRSSVLQEKKHSGMFSDVLSSVDWNPKNLEIALLSFTEGRIDSISLVKRGRKVATAKYRVEFFEFVDFQPPIYVTEIEAELQIQLRKYFSRSATGHGRRIPQTTWSEVIYIIKSIRPAQQEEIEYLEGRKEKSALALKSHQFEIVAQERDAVGLAIQIGGFDRKESLRELGYSLSNDDPAPFLSGNTQFNIMEDQMINHDASVFGEWELISKYLVGAVKFEKGREAITVMNVNRTKVERTYGVDLIYYHHVYNAYIMLQYKRLDKARNGSFQYRPDDQFYKEISRMRSVNSLSDKNNFGSPEDYRLSSDMFYLKFCKSIVLEPESTDMIDGFYVPLKYWDCIEEYGRLKGLRGGIVVSNENVTRYLNNTQFIWLAEKGWIGSRIRDSKQISKIIKESLESNRSLVLAYSQELSENQQGY